jgi:catechol 2,3-dioxygenase-like lactoylglutathione lyase family enzyme
VTDDARIFHVNVNCSELATSRTFYVERAGLAEGVRTTPDAPQPGIAFGLDRARWDAWILVGDAGFEGGAIDLLEWQEPQPEGAAHAPSEPGFAGVGIAVAPGQPTGTVHDPDGVLVELVTGAPTGLAYVRVEYTDLGRSRAFYAALGFREAGVADDRTVLTAPGGGPVQLVLGPAGDAAPAPRPANTIGIWRTALLLSDLDAAIARLHAAGVSFLSDAQSMAMGPGLPELRFVCCRGPDQEVIELIESPTPTEEP